MVIVPLSSLQSIAPMETKSNISEGSVSQENLSFSNIFKEALNDAKEAQAISEQDAYDLSLGKTDNLSQIMINSAKANTAVQMTVELTSRAVSSYKEIMQMQV